MKNLLLANIFAFVLFINSFAQEKLIYNSQIPVIAYGGLREVTLPRYEEMQNAGFTMSIDYCSDIAEAEKKLAIAEKLGLKLIISTPELKTDLEKTVKRLMNNPALFGYYIIDEPPASQFKELGDLVRKIKKIDSKHSCYVNLLPNYATREQLGTGTYQAHVDSCAKMIPLDFFSFDFYPTHLTKPEILEGWYQNLEVFRQKTIETGKPFWAFVLSDIYSRRQPLQTLAMMRLQAYSNLAYGAQGIQYYLYWNEGAWSSSAPIYKGKRTILYDRVKQMNEEIRNLSPVFLGSKLISVKHTGLVIPFGTTRVTDLPYPVKVLETGNEGAIVSIFENGNNTFLVIVNRDFYKEMQLTIYGDESLKKVLKNGEIVPASTYATTMVIDAGDASIYMYPTKQQH